MSLDEQVELGHKLFADRYRLKKLLGRGGMGAVYLAQDVLLDDQEVAVKLLHSELCQNSKHTKRFLREVQLTRLVTHPNVVRTYEAGTQQDRLYFTMEFAPGITLKERIAEGPFEPVEVARIIREICKGLTAIHQADIIHRDLKPGNVVLTPDGDIKITDFGVAKPGTSDLTSHNEVIGSVSYMAPEVWVGRDVGRPADIYALGIMSYEMLTGNPPFEGDSPAELMGKHLEVQPVPPQESHPQIPQWLNDLVMRMLDKNQMFRPQTADEVAQHIDFHLDGLGELPKLKPRSEAIRGYEVVREQGVPSSFDALLERPPALDDLEDEETAVTAINAKLRSAEMLTITKIQESNEDLCDVQLMKEWPGPAVRISIVLVFSALLVWASLSSVHPVIAIVWDYARSKGGLFSVAGTLVGISGFYCLVLTLPMLILASFRRSLVISLYAWGRMAGTLLALGGALFVINSTRVELKSYELNLNFDRGRFFSTAEAMLVNLTEASLLVPHGTAFRSAIKFRYPVLIETEAATAAERTPYYLLLGAYIFCFLRLAERWVFRRLKTSARFIACGTILVAMPLVLELVVYGVFARYLDVYTLKIYGFSVGSLHHSFSEYTVVSCLINWAVLFAVMVLAMPWLLKRLERRKKVVDSKPTLSLEQPR